MKTVTMGAILISGIAAWGQAEAQVVRPSDAAASSAMLAYAAKLKVDWARRAALGEVPATITEPSVKSGKILTPSIDVTKAPGVAALQLTLNAGTVGVANVLVSLVSPSGNHSVFGGTYIPAYPAEPPTHAISFQVPSMLNFSIFGLYAEPGGWTISSVQLTSKDGNFVFYEGNELASLFPSIVLNVANSGTPDVTPPIVGRGKVLTPVISLSGSSPYFAARMAVADDVSGVGSVSVQAFGPGSSSFPTVFASANIPLPVRQGHVVPNAMLPANSATGTYTISGYSVCDAANNCTEGSGSSAVQTEFGTTTFQVTP